MEVLGSGHGSITREGVDHTRIGCDRGTTTEELGQQEDDQQQKCPSVTNRVQEDLDNRVSRIRVEDTVEILDSKGKRKEVSESSNKGDTDSHHDSDWSSNIGVHGLLGHVGRGIITGHGELRLEKTQKDHIDGAAPAGVVDEMCENKRSRGLVLGLDENRDQDDDDASNVHPDRGGIHDSNVPDEKGVDESVDDEDHKVDQDNMPAFVYPSCLERNDRAQQKRQTEINSYTY